MASCVYKKRASSYYEKLEYPKGLYPVAVKIQPKLMQFIKNYGSLK